MKVEVDLTDYLISEEEFNNFFKDASKEIIDMEEYDESRYRIPENETPGT